MEGTRLPLPLGCKFQPSDEQLVQFYLFNKISGIPAPFVDDLVRTENLYGSKEPWQIWRQFGGPDLEDGEDLYFFTPLKRKSVNGSRIDRRVGSGTWQGEDAGKAVVSRNSRKKIGSKKRFRYEKDKSPHNGCWIMHEYSLNPSLLPQNLRSRDLVLCRIRKNGEPAAAGQETSRKRRKLDKPVVKEDIDLPAEPVVVEELQYQYLQETQPQPSTELTPHNHLQPFQNHQLMQQTPADFFIAQEGIYQQSMTQEDPHDVELSDSHQNIQETPATDQNSHELLHLSAETHQHFALSDLQEYQQKPVTDQIPHHQLQLSVEVCQTTVHPPFISEENQDAVVSTQQITYEQHECCVDNYRYMVHRSSDIEGNQQLSASEQNLYEQLEQSVEKHESLLPNQPNFQEDEQLPGTEQSLYDQLEQTIENHQQMLQIPSNIEGCQDLLPFDDTPQWLLYSSDDNLSQKKVQHMQMANIKPVATSDMLQQNPLISQESDNSHQMPLPTTPHHFQSTSHKSQHSSAQVYQKNLPLALSKPVTPLYSANSPSITSSPSIPFTPFSITADSEKHPSDISPQLISRNLGHPQRNFSLNIVDTENEVTTPFLPVAQAGISASIFPTESSSPNYEQKSSAVKEPLERLLKAVQSLSPKTLSASVSDIGSALKTVHAISGTACNDSGVGVDENLQSETVCCMHGRNFSLQRACSSEAKMTSKTNPIALDKIDILKQSAGQIWDTHTSRIIKRRRVEPSNTLLDEIKCINQWMIETEIDLDLTEDPSALDAGEGTIVRCVYSGVALDENFKTQFASQTLPLPLRLFVPASYPNASPVTLGGSSFDRR